MPDDESGKHVMYVWFDALTNYLSGSCNQLAADAKGLGFKAPGAAWPAALHVVGRNMYVFVYAHTYIFKYLYTYVHDEYMCKYVCIYI